MDKAKAAVSDFISKSGHHDTQVHERVDPSVTRETVKPHQREERQIATDREVHQDHYHTTVQPVHHREVLPEHHHHNIIPVEHRTHDKRDDQDTTQRLQSTKAQFKDESIRSDMAHTSQAMPSVGGEHVHHHIHETIQPVVHKETVEPHVMHTTVPIHEVHHNKAQHHAATSLPAMTMDEFKKSGGSLTGREERIDHFKGEPKNIERSLAGGSGGLRDSGFSSGGAAPGALAAESGSRDMAGTTGMTGTHHGQHGQHGHHGHQGQTGISPTTTSTTTGTTMGGHPGSTGGDVHAHPGTTGSSHGVGSTAAGTAAGLGAGAVAGDKLADREHPSSSVGLTGNKGSGSANQGVTADSFIKNRGANTNVGDTGSRSAVSGMTGNPDERVPAMTGSSGDRSNPTMRSGAGAAGAGAVGAGAAGTGLTGSTTGSSTGAGDYKSGKVSGDQGYGEFGHRHDGQHPQSVEQNLPGQGTTTGPTTSGSSAAGTGGVAGTTRKPSLMDRLNPKKDADGDGKAGFLS